MSNRRQKYLVTMIAAMILLIYAVLLGALSYPTRMNNINAVIALCISGYLLYAVRKRPDLLIVTLCIFYENYSVVVGCYLDPSIRPGWMFRQFTNDRSYGIATLSLLIFESVLLIGYYLYREKIEQECISIEQFPDNNLIMLGCMGLYVLIFLTQVDFAEGARASSNVLNEYKFVLVIIGSLYSSKTNLNKWLWTGIVGLTSIATFFGGNRVNTLCNVFILAVLWFSEYITLKNVIIVSIPSIFIMLMIGAMRFNFTLSANAIQTVWASVKSDKLVADSFTFAYGPTIAAEELSLKLGWSQKVKLLIDNILYIFLGGSYGQYSLSNYTRNYYMHYFGFMGANYFDIWFGALGGAIAGISIVWVLFLKGRVRTQSTQVGRIAAIAAVANTMRWYNYNFMQFYRTVFVVLLVWYAAVLANNFVMKKYKMERSL